MINKAYQDFTNEKYDKNRNYNKIMQKVEQENKHFRFSGIPAVVVAVLAIFIITPSIYAKIMWNAEFKEYLYRPVGEAKGSLEEARESEYAEVIDMDYLVQDGIGVKVDSMLITDDCFDVNVYFKFDNDITVDSKGFDYGYAVYDEYNNIYTIAERTLANGKLANRTKFIYKELGLKYNSRNYYDIQFCNGSTVGPREVNENDRVITSEFTLRAKDAFPKSKKIYIRIFDLGYRMADIDEENIKSSQVEIFDISNAEWIFEIDVPEKFYTRETMELKLKDEIPDVEIEKIILTETGLVVNVASEKVQENYFKAMNNANKFMVESEKVCGITDGEGKSYHMEGSAAGDNKCEFNFQASKNDFNKKLYISFTIDGKVYTSELIEK